MTDPKLVTERDAVLRERAAFQQGADAVFKHFGIGFGTQTSKSWEGSAYIAASRYPLPRVTRARVVTYRYSGFRYRIIDGELQFKSADDTVWRRSLLNDQPLVLLNSSDRETARMVLDLLDNPTETCPDE